MLSTTVSELELQAAPVELAFTLSDQVLSEPSYFLSLPKSGC